MINKLLTNEIKTKEDVYKFLVEYLKEEIELSIRKTQKEESFELPSWSEYQAFHLGMQKAFRKILELVPDQGEK